MLTNNNSSLVNANNYNKQFIFKKIIHILTLSIEFSIIGLRKISGGGGHNIDLCQHPGYIQHHCINKNRRKSVMGGWVVAPSSNKGLPIRK